MSYEAVAHKQGDDVAVAVLDVAPGQEVKVHFVDGGSPLSVRASEAIALGHKFALRDIREGDKVVGYGEHLGKAVAPIPKGAHVHVHNLKSLRWPPA